MKLSTVFLVVWIFILSVFVFPIMQDRVSTANLTGNPYSSVIQVFPTILLVVFIVLPLYFVLKGEN